MTTAVAAAASVPSSFTSANALCITSPINRLFVPSIPEKSASGENAIGIPIAASDSGNRYAVSILNFGNQTFTRCDSNSPVINQSVLGSRGFSAADRLLPFGSRTIMESCFLPVCQPAWLNLALRKKFFAGILSGRKHHTISRLIATFAPAYPSENVPYFPPPPG